MARLQKKRPVVRKSNKLKKPGEGETQTKSALAESDNRVRAFTPQKGKDEAARKYPFSSRVPASGTRIRFVQQSLQFLKEVKAELKRVTWPTQKQTVASTIGVIVLVMILSVFLGLVDAGLSGLVRVVLN